MKMQFSCPTDPIFLTLLKNNFTFLLIEFLIDPVGISYICLENQQIKMKFQFTFFTFHRRTIYVRYEKTQRSGCR